MKEKEKYRELPEFMVRILSGEASSEDKKLGDEWLKADPLHEELFASFKKVWEEAGNAHALKNLDTDREWDRLHKAITKERLVSTPFMYRVFSPRPWFIRTAAMLGIVLLSAAAYYIIRETILMRSFSTVDQIMSLQLPDGSDVVLNRQSEIVFPGAFNKNRTVQLTGEAYFEVEHDPLHPFTVLAGEAEVRVLGTSFNVKNITDQQLVEVLVESGQVALSSTEGEPGEKLFPGNTGRVENGKVRILESGETDLNALAWKTRKMVFVNTPLVKVVETLNMVYGDKLYLQEKSIADCRLTASFSDRDLASVMEVLVASLNLEYRQEGNTYILTGGNCR